MNKTKIVSVMLLFALTLSACRNNTADTSDISDTPDTSADISDISGTETELTVYTESMATTEQVNDTTAPVLLSARNSVRLNVGDIFDANEYISYIDDYDSSPKLSLETEVDTTVAGTYETAIIVTDASGNRTRKSLTVRVVGEDESKSSPTPTPEGFTPTPTPSPTPTPVPETLSFDEFKSRFASDPSVEFGIDVSKWQGDVDYGAVKAAGCTFVIVKIGTYHKGEFVIDAKFEENLTNAKAAGLKVGGYFYTPVTSEEVIRDNADKICEALAGRTLDLPVAYDMEQWDRFQQYKISLIELNELFYSFCEQLEQHGYSGMLYNGKNKLETVWDAKGRPVWLAHYSKETDYSGDYFMWQASNVGRIDGINGDVDLNVMYPGRYDNG